MNTPSRQNRIRLITRLEQVFRDIETTRMQGLPFVNPRLEVRALGFKRWQQGRLGIMLTPWFMNLLWIAEAAKDKHEPNQPAIGSKVYRELPSGQYEFVVAWEQQLGYFQNCSLFSPVLMFEDQAAALKTARAALLAVMNTELNGQPPDNTASATETATNDPQQPLDRRAFLRADFIKKQPPATEDKRA